MTILQYKCNNCNKKWKKKYLFDRHVLMCNLLIKTPEERTNERDELNDVPSYLDLYKIVQEMGIKQQKMEKQLDQMIKYIDQKKKKINILNWLKNYCDTSTNFDNWKENISIDSNHLDTIFETNLTSGISSIIIDNLSDKTNSPIRAFDQKPNTFYIYLNDSWNILSNNEFDIMIQNISKQIFAAFNEWQLQKRSTLDEDQFGTLYCQYCKKLFNGKQTIASVNRTIKSRVYKYLKVSLKDIYEFEFDFT